MTKAADIGWLIERHINSELLYWDGRGVERNCWTTDASEAVRFARAEDADRVLGWPLKGEGRVAEHMWPTFGESQPVPSERARPEVITQLLAVDDTGTVANYIRQLEAELAAETAEIDRLKMPIGEDGCCLLCGADAAFQTTDGGAITLKAGVVDGVIYCYGGCGLPYEDFPLDVNLPTPLWNRIAVGPPFDETQPKVEREGRGGVLCAACIVRRLSKLPNVTAALLTVDEAGESQPPQELARDRLEPLSLL